MSNIIGSFYLIQNETGNLMGEFTNNIRFSVTVESACRKEAGAKAYEGRYSSMWIEGGLPCLAELIIGIKNTGKAFNYSLVWNDYNKKPLYRAEAFLAEGMLVGHYISLS
ncbi:hypothetical protein LRS05_15520 [Flavobacterium sp. J372]|uniref:hypothetical protein n=1 Tax=Flavobacterium sp. J372 TaxID=2898436 RepID=UPI002151A422|nr:hypothetical protein [Flavobacterium sp. J372]MCR5863438.1 hypothetical protein [Flavobacterium sp. J372]